MSDPIAPDEQPVESVEDADVFPQQVVDDDDPLGIEAAIQIANGVAGIPSANRRSPRRWRPPATDAPEFSSSGPGPRDPQLVAGVLDQFVTDSGWRTQIGVRRLLIDSWPKLVGPVNAEHSRPISFDGGVLFVQAESTTWATVLRQLAPQIVAKLNAELGDGSVVRIDVRGPAAPSWKHGPRSVRDGRGPRDTYG